MEGRTAMLKEEQSIQLAKTNMCEWHKNDYEQTGMYKSLVYQQRHKLSVGTRFEGNFNSGEVLLRNNKISEIGVRVSNIRSSEPISNIRVTNHNDET